VHSVRDETVRGIRGGPVLLIALSLKVPGRGGFGRRSRMNRRREGPGGTQGE